ncbi:MAG: nucleotidyltransferase domain-containing protein [Peptococcaceae bacterium]|nr:nucleotidyltransferase domain-containing protein [Peptococcaceae bacterium]
MDGKLMNQIELLDEHIHLLAKGEEGSKSDLDLAVLFFPYSPDKHNLQLLVRLEQDISRTLPFSKVDLVLLQKERITFKFEVIKTGKVIYCLDEDERTDFENIVVRDYLDFAPFLNRYWQEMVESIRGGEFLAQ